MQIEEHEAQMRAMKEQDRNGVHIMADPAIPNYGVKVNGRAVGTAKVDKDIEAELAEFMFRERMSNRISAFVQNMLDEEEASRMNAAGVTLMQYRRKQLLGSAAAIWPFPRQRHDSIVSAA